MIPLCNRVIEIVGPKLAQAPAEKERMVLLNQYHWLFQVLLKKVVQAPLLAGS